MRLRDRARRIVLSATLPFAGLFQNFRTRTPNTRIIARTGDARYVPQATRWGNSKRGVRYVIASRLDDVSYYDYDRIRNYPIIKDGIRQIVLAAARANFHIVCDRSDLAELAQQELGDMISDLVKQVLRGGFHYGFHVVWPRWVPKFDVRVGKSLGEGTNAATNVDESDEGTESATPSKYWPYCWTIKRFYHFRPQDIILLVDTVTGDWAGVKQLYPVAGNENGEIFFPQVMIWTNDKEYDRNYGIPMTKAALPFVEVCESLWDSIAIYGELYAVPGIVGRYPVGRRPIGRDEAGRPLFTENVDQMQALMEGIGRGQRMSLPSELYPGTSERKWGLDFFQPSGNNQPYTDLLNAAHEQIRLAIGVTEAATSESQKVGGLGDNGADTKINVQLANVETYLDEVLHAIINPLLEQFRVYNVGPSAPVLRGYFEPVDLQTTKGLLAAIVQMLSGGQPVQDANGNYIYPDWNKILQDKGIPIISVPAKKMASQLYQDAMNQLGGRIFGQGSTTGGKPSDPLNENKESLNKVDASEAAAIVRRAIDNLETAEGVKRSLRAALAEWDESKHPRDEDGKFASHNSLDTEAPHARINRSIDIWDKGRPHSSGHSVASAAKALEGQIKGDSLQVVGNGSSAHEKRINSLAKALGMTVSKKEPHTIDGNQMLDDHVYTLVRNQAGGSTDVGQDEEERAYKGRPSSLERDENGMPVSKPVGKLHDFVPTANPAHSPYSEEEWSGIQTRQANRIKAGAVIDPALQVDHGPIREGEKLKRVTEFDTPEVMRQREAIVNWEAKYKAEHGLGAGGTSEIDTPERKQLRSQIAMDLYGAGAAKQERKAYIITGPPGSGKSSLVRREGYTSAEGHGAIEIDADAAKEQLPEFNGGRGANLVHEESSNIAEAVRQMAFRNGDNVVAPIVGKSAASVRKLINQLQEAGYEVNVDNIKMSPEQSAESVVARYHKNGRFVPPEYAFGMDHLPAITHDEVAREYAGNESVRFRQFDSNDLMKKNSS